MTLQHIVDPVSTKDIELFRNEKALFYDSRWGKNPLPDRKKLTDQEVIGILLAKDRVAHTDKQFGKMFNTLPINARVINLLTGETRDLSIVKYDGCEYETSLGVNIGHSGFIPLPTGFLTCFNYFPFFKIEKI